MIRESTQTEYSDEEFKKVEYSDSEYNKNTQVTKYDSPNYTIVVQTANIKFMPPKALRYNLVDALWEELEYYLTDDDDFKIEKIENNAITIKALRKESFHNFYVMAKIIGKIVPFNGTIKLKMKEFRALDFVNDMLIYNFTIKSDFGNFYKGIIYIIK